MVTISDIKHYSEIIRDQCSPEKIILFGSYADGTADEKSDIDLFVVLNTELKPARRYPYIRKMLAGNQVSFDIVVKTPEEFERSKNIVNTISYFANKYGKVIYEK